MKLAFLLSFLIASSSFAAETALVPPIQRPPQYVLLAFDGSLNIDMWNETLTFAQTNQNKFTYFISGVYFLLQPNKNNYVEPVHGMGKSNIGWGGTSPDVLQKRVNFVNQAYDAGQEIASHANGHYDGSKYTLENWRSEFKQFYNLIFNVLFLNGLEPKPANPYHFKPEQITGFRAPLLGQNPAMYSVLKEYHYAYDTSKTANMNYWPEKQNDIWNFPLAQLRIAGTGKKTLSMDFNFYFTQSNGLPDPANYQKYHDEMYNTYLGYFESNYYGNRAPIHIGHHFSKWNKGAYWDAMQDFARHVCGMPEVRCVTYTELTNFMNTLTPPTLAAYKAGLFPKMPPPARSLARVSSVRPLNAQLTIEDNHQGTLSAVTSGSEAAQITPADENTEYVWKVNNQEVLRTREAQVPAAQLTNHLDYGDNLSVTIVQKNNQKEIMKTTRQVYSADRNALQLYTNDLEDTALQGDLPQAHDEEQ